ncbi:MAG: hypothetical protein LUC43_06500 [Burkholderiales bacterium]|nr:hypothetical protein [Burkholderiales bacterium]
MAYEFWKRFATQGQGSDSEFWKVFYVKEKKDKPWINHLRSDEMPTGVAMYAGLNFVAEYIDIHIEVTKKYSQKYRNQTALLKEKLPGTWDDDWFDHRDTRDLIGFKKYGVDLMDKDKWPQYIEWLQNSALKCLKVLKEIDHP